jgi:hypothetical protein
MVGSSHYMQIVYNTVTNTLDYYVSASSAAVKSLIVEASMKVLLVFYLSPNLNLNVNLSFND